MNCKEAAFHCFLAIFVVAGVLSGNYMLVRNLARPPADAANSGFGLLPLDNGAQPPGAHPDTPALLPLTAEGTNNSAQPAAAAPRLLTPSDARPLSTGTDPTASHAVIEHELRDAPQDEREVWTEELQHLPPAMVNDIMRVRSRQRPLAPKLLSGQTDTDGSIHGGTHR